MLTADVALPASHGRKRHWNIAGVAGRAPKTRESRRRRRQGGCAPSQEICEFFFSKWCDMVHTGRVADENDSDLRYSEVPLKGKK